MRLEVRGVGVWAPGLTSWPMARAVFIGQASYAREASLPPPPQLLPPRERRRSTATVRLALEVGRQACEAAGEDPANLPGVFSSSSGDLEILDYMCKSLAEPQPSLSPTQFHNSVHNAPAGYWTIGTGCRASSSSLSAGDDSFAAGLLEAATRVLATDAAVLLIAYDAPAPFPINAAYPISSFFGVGLVLSRAGGSHAGVAALDITVGSTPSRASRMSDERLENLRCSNPIAASLPLLAALAQASDAEINLALGRAAHLAIKILPWQ